MNRKHRAACCWVGNAQCDAKVPTDPAWRTWFRDSRCLCSSGCGFSMQNDSWISQAVFLCSWKPVPCSVQHCWVTFLALAWAFAAPTTWNQLAVTMLVFGKKRSSESNCFGGRNGATSRCLSLVLGLTGPNSLLRDMKRWRVLKLGHITPNPVVLRVLTERSKNSTDKRKINAEGRDNASNVHFKALENTLYTSGMERTENSWL